MRNNLIALSGIALIALTLPLGFGGRSAAPEATVQAAPPQTVASGNDLYCAGFIRPEPMKTKLQIIGAEEKGLSAYTPGNKVIYLSQGATEGVKVGDAYAVVRTQGKFRNEFSKKQLGYLHQEVGVVRVLAVQDSTATAEVAFACEDLRKGDMLVPFERRLTPQIRAYRPLDRHSEVYRQPDALRGQLVAIRYDQATATERSVVHLDLGSDDAVKVGDYFTVLSRPEGMTLDKFAQTRSGGSVKVAQEKEEVLKSLPPRVAGEVVVIHVEQKSATAVVTRQVNEILKGDFVQRQ